MAVKCCQTAKCNPCECVSYLSIFLINVSITPITYSGKWSGHKKTVRNAAKNYTTIYTRKTCTLCNGLESKINIIKNYCNFMQMFKLFSMNTGVKNLLSLKKTSPFTFIIKKRYCIYKYKYVAWCVNTIIRYISILETTIFTLCIVCA